MKISKTVNRGLYTLLILGLADKDKSVSSRILSQLLQVSDSATKKMLTNLARAGLVQSTEGQQGGFALKKPLEAITLLELWKALDDVVIRPEQDNLAQGIFTKPEQMMIASQRINQTFEQANHAFQAALTELTLDQLLVADYDSQNLDWQALLEEK